MSFTKLFNDDYEVYTEAGNRLYAAATDALEPLITKAVADGVALRDVEAVLSHAVSLNISAAILHRNHANRKR